MSRRDDIAGRMAESVVKRLVGRKLVEIKDEARARDVIRHLALLLLDPAPFTSERFKQIVTYLKETCGLRSRDLFHPIRLSLAGRIGEGELDRVILLLDEAATLNFALPAKSVRTRIPEFCSALD